MKSTRRRFLVPKALIGLDETVLPTEERSTARNTGFWLRLFKQDVCQPRSISQNNRPQMISSLALRLSLSLLNPPFVSFQTTHIYEICKHPLLSMILPLIKKCRISIHHMTCQIRRNPQPCFFASFRNQYDPLRYTYPFSALLSTIPPPLFPHFLHFDHRSTITTIAFLFSQNRDGLIKCVFFADFGRPAPAHNQSAYRLLLA